MYRRATPGQPLIVLLAFALSTAGCDSTATSAPPTAAPSSSERVSAPTPARVLTATVLADSIRFRTDVGLRADEAWIREVAGRATTDWITYAVPLTPEEVSELGQRAADMDALKPIVIPYGLAHPDEWAGAWIDNDRGLMVIQFSGHIEDHRRALMALLSPKARVEFRLVRWSEQYLKTQAERVRGTDSWFATIPARLTGWGTDTSDNKVILEVSSPVKDVQDQVLAHFGWSMDVAEVESDGTGVWLLPHGALDLTIRDRNGAPVAGVECIPNGDLGTPDLNPPRTDSRGRCSFEALPATGYWIEIGRRKAGGGYDVLGYGRVVVVANSTTAATVVVSAR
jgi:hypothetical protein